MFFVLIFFLYMAQLFIIKPGSDISEAFGKTETYTLGGMTYSAIISIMLIGWIIWCFVLKGRNTKKYSQSDNSCVMELSACVLLGIFAEAISGYPLQPDYIMKTIFPFFVFFYMKYMFDYNRTQVMYRLITWINVIMLTQILICKIYTGHFSASTYYTYLDMEEYFGYYSSPHPLSALLGLCTLWSIFCIIKHIKSSINIVLIVLNMFVMIKLGVRSYLIALMVAMMGMFMYYLRRTKYKKYLPIVLIVTIVAAVVMYVFLDKIFTGTRFDAEVNTSELTSGRRIRWYECLKYYLNEFNIFEKFIGVGFGSVYRINAITTGASMNSLNFLIDTLIDNGVIGLILIILAYKNIFGTLIGEYNRFLMYGIGGFILTGLFVNNILTYITIMSLAIIMLMISRERYKV